MQPNVPLYHYFVTWVTHNSRLSERMVTFLPEQFIKGMKPLIFKKNDQIRIAQIIEDGIQRYSLSTVTFNVLPDHVHMVVIVESEEELRMKIGNIKGYTAHVLRKETGIVSRVWAQKFHRVIVNDARHLENVINYTKNNHVKHEPGWGMKNLCGFFDELDGIRERVCVDM